MEARAILPAGQGALRDPPAAAAFPLGFFLQLLAGAPESALALLVPDNRSVELARRRNPATASA